MAEDTSTQVISQDASQEDRIKELTEENELLFEQLHVVQEELEKYYHKLKECEERKSTAPAPASAGAMSAASPEVADALTENMKLKAQVEQLKIALRVESQNSLQARLGNMLIEGASSTGSLLALPRKLLKMWRILQQTTPPAALGGKSFQKVIDAYESGKDEAVEKLLDSVSISHTMRANAYTALARHCKNWNARKAADFARLAWECDPKSYRMKFLAFRQYEADDVVMAAALLDMLSAGVQMSEWEERKSRQIRQNSKQSSMEAVRHKTPALEQATRQDHEIRSLRDKLTKARQEADQQKQSADTQKREADALAIQTGRMLKNLLTQFETDTAVLSKVMRVVMRGV